MTTCRFFRAVLTAIPYVGSPLEQFIFGSQDDKEFEKLKDKIAKGDEALNIKRDKEGNVTNNPFDFGEYERNNQYNKKCIILLLLLLVIDSFAQDIEVKDICQLTTDLSARTKGRISPDGKDCALIRVNVPTIKAMDFNNSNIGEISHISGEYSLYVPEGTKQIPFSVQGYNNGVIDFEKYNISIEGKCVYRVTLSIQNGAKQTEHNGGSLKITTVSSYILLDGISVGESPLTIDNVSAGKHTIAFPNTAGYSLPDQTITISKGETVEKQFELVDAEYDDFFIPMIFSDSDGGWSKPLKYLTIKQNGNWGLTDLTGKIIVPCEYDYIYPDPANGLFKVGKYIDDHLLSGMYHPQKGLVIPCKYEQIVQEEGNPYIIIRQNNKWGIAELNGNEVVPCIYESVSQIRKRMSDEVYKGVFYVIKEEGNKLLNLNTGETLENIHLISSFFENGVGFAYDRHHHCYIIDTLCNFMPLPEGYDYDHNFEYSYSEGIMGVKKKGEDKYGVINKRGEELTPFIYNKVICAKYGFVVLSRAEGEYTVVDKNGHCYTSSDVDFVTDRYISLQKDGKKGLIDINGNTVLPFEFKDIYYYKRDNIIEAKKEGTKFKYDTSLNLIESSPVNKVIEELYEENHNDWRYDIIRKGDFYLIFDTDERRYGYVNSKNEILTGCMYALGELDELYYNWPGKLIMDNVAILCLGDRFGLIDKNGKFVVPLIYSFILPFEDGTVYARKRDGTWFELNIEDYSKP